MVLSLSISLSLSLSFSLALSLSRSLARSLSRPLALSLSRPLALSLSRSRSLFSSEDCFYYFSERNNVVVLFGTLYMQSFILTEVSDCGLLIVITSSTFLRSKDMSKEKIS